MATWVSPSKLLLGQSSKINPTLEKYVHSSSQREVSLKCTFVTALASFEPNHPGTIFLKHRELRSSVSSLAIHLCIGLQHPYSLALVSFKPHLIMQLNYSENNSFAEYATASSSYFDVGRQKEKAVLFQVQAFLWGSSDVQKPEPSLLCLKSNTFFSSLSDVPTST